MTQKTTNYNNTNNNKQNRLHAVLTVTNNDMKCMDKG